MLTHKLGAQLKLHTVTIEDMVPQEHLVRKIDKLLDLDFVYDLVEALYCKNNGRPSIDPVVLVKFLLVGYLFGIPSERRIEQEIAVNMAYRWFLGLDIDEAVPDHSTISQNRRRRFQGATLFREIFERIVEQCIAAGLVTGSALGTDSTHVKANASRKSEVVVTVEQTPHAYLELLDAYEEAERETSGKEKRVRKASTTVKYKEKRMSPSDPEAGFLARPGKPNGMHYLSHETVDFAHGIITDVAVTAGDCADMTQLLGRLAYQQKRFGFQIKELAADSGYDSSLIHQALLEQEIEFYVPDHDKTVAASVEVQRDAFTYSEMENVFRCPARKLLAMHNIERGESNILRVYKANRADCKSCPFKAKCVAPSHSERTLRVNIFAKAEQKQKEKNGSERHKKLLLLRQIWCEGSFAAQKRAHNLTGLLRRGLEAAQTHCLLSATALNLKRMVRCMG